MRILKLNCKARVMMKEIHYKVFEYVTNWLYSKAR